MEKVIHAEVRVTPNDINRVLNERYNRHTSYFDLLAPYPDAVPEPPLWDEVGDELLALGRAIVDQVRNVDNVEVPITREEVMEIVYGDARWPFQVPTPDEFGFVPSEAEGIWKVTLKKLGLL